MSVIHSRFETFDWSFVDAPRNSGIHAIHPYPAKFIPQIPRKLIELYHPGDSSLIFDPFSGSGTTLVESIAHGIDTFGVDLNPLACLIARAKTTPLPRNFSAVARAIVASARYRLRSGQLEVPAIPRLDHWFNREVQFALTALTQCITEEHILPLREALQVSVSSIIVRVSNQESDTRYAAVQKNVSAEDVFGHFLRAADRTQRALDPFTSDLFRRHGTATVLNADLMDLTEADLPKNVGLVITSPPYPNAYEYWLYHKYRMYWLGMNPIEVREREIGARPHYFKKNHQDEQDFERQMTRCFKLLAAVMRKGSMACFLVGRSIIHGREIDNVALLVRAAASAGFALNGVAERPIPRTRKAFNPTNSKINREHVLVLRLEETP